MSIVSERSASKPPPIPARPLGLYQPLATSEPSCGLTPTSKVSDASSCQLEMKDLRNVNPQGHSRTVSGVSRQGFDRQDETPARLVPNPGHFTSPTFHSLVDKKNAESSATGKQHIAEHGSPKWKSISHHSFFSDGNEVKHMEGALMELLDDFRSGKLRAFGNDGSLEQMVAIRDQQEKLAKMHFDLVAKQSKSRASTDSSKTSIDNMKELISGLEELSVAIERLHSSSAESKSSERTGEASPKS